MHSLRQLVQWTGARNTGATLPDVSISELCTDSRSVARPEETLFVALRTARRDGHRFVMHAYS